MYELITWKSCKNANSDSQDMGEVGIPIPNKPPNPAEPASPRRALAIAKSLAI